jgi:hypothetical protein
MDVAAPPPAAADDAEDQPVFRAQSLQGGRGDPHRGETGASAPEKGPSADRSTLRHVGGAPFHRSGGERNKLPGARILVAEGVAGKRRPRLRGALHKKKRLPRPRGPGNRLFGEQRMGLGI